MICIGIYCKYYRVLLFDFIFDVGDSDFYYIDNKFRYIKFI